MSAGRMYSECRLRGPLTAAIIGASMSSRFMRTFLPSRKNLVVTLRREEVETVGTDRLHKGVAAAGQDDDAVLGVGADRVKQMHQLLVGVPIKHQRAAIYVKRQFQHAGCRTGQPGVGRFRDMRRTGSRTCTLSCAVTSVVWSHQVETARAISAGPRPAWPICDDRLFTKVGREARRSSSDTP
jgi:hypothetical protein